MTCYHHLSPEERAVIMLESQQGQSIRCIADLLNRSPSTISRELKRHRSDNDAAYCATTAACQYWDNRQRSVRRRKLEINTTLYVLVTDWLLDYQWSPEQISGTLKSLYPGDKSMHVSHETIYACIYAHPRGELKKLLIQALRRGKSKRGPRGSKNTSYSSLKIAEEQRIVNRPEEINERKIPGHWEGDLIVGAYNQSCVGTLVERTTGYLLLCKMRSKSAADVRQGFEKKLQDLPDCLRRSMTYDRGAEMAEHALMTKELKMTIYFADPHAPWQRGSNENINGLLRQYLPKGTDLSVFSQGDLDRIAWLLNTRPRKRFKFLAPEEKFIEFMDEHLINVALDS